jgi:hypothetical protein
VENFNQLSYDTLHQSSPLRKEVDLDDHDGNLQTNHLAFLGVGLDVNDELFFLAFQFGSLPIQFSSSFLQRPLMFPHPFGG